MLPHCRVADAGSARNLSVIAARSLSFKIDPIVTSFNHSVHFSSSFFKWTTKFVSDRFAVRELEDDATTCIDCGSGKK